MILRSFQREHRAFIIPVVILLAVVMLLFLMFLVNNMTQSKAQKLATTHTTKAYFMAQAGIQHMKLKYKLLPQESFNAGFLQYGFNPWFNDRITDFRGGGDKFPHFIASMAADVTTSGSVGDRQYPLTPTDGVSEMSSFKGLPLGAGGFKLSDNEDADDDFSEWGYCVTNIKSGTVRYDPPDKPKIKEQSIEYTVIGWAKQITGQNVKVEDTELIKKWEARETLIIKSRFTGKDYGN